MLAASVLATGSQANSSCVDNTDRIGFGVIGAIQGAIIGGPVGMFWALGLMKYADSYENPVECNQKKLAIKFEQKKQLAEEDLDLSPYDVVVYNSFINFDYNSYVVKTVPTTLDLIEKKNIESIIVNGHTDKCGTNEYNFALGLKRAKEVKQLLVDYSFDEKLIKTISYGESNPISSNDASNRRVDLNIKYKND